MSNPLHCIEFGPPKFFSKTCKFLIIFCSTLQFSGGDHLRADPEKQNRNSRKSLANSRNLLEQFLRSRKEENLYGHCDVNNARRSLSKGSALLRGCWFLSQKLDFRKNIDWNFITVERVRDARVMCVKIFVLR